MHIGLFGFPFTGKSTIFRLLTGVEPSARGRGEAQVGVVRVPDGRLDRLSEMYRPRKTTPATIEYLDLAGVEKGETSKALPLDRLRTADALAHVVRGFRDDALPHTEGDIDPARDVDIMETEFILADHSVAERRVEKLRLQVQKTRNDDDRRELELMERCLEALESETPLRELELSPEDDKLLRGYTFLSRKPLLIVVNAGEDRAARLDGCAAELGLERYLERPATEIVALSAKIEAEIAQLDAADAEAFRSEMGIAEPALDRMIRASYRLLGRISFFTVGNDECRAWTIRSGTPARRAAGAVHTDIEKGFIRAELVDFAGLVEAGSWQAARERGTIRLEGKGYVIRDGDVVDFRFNV